MIINNKINDHIAPSSPLVSNLSKASVWKGGKLKIFHSLLRYCRRGVKIFRKFHRINTKGDAQILK